MTPSDDPALIPLPIRHLHAAIAALPAQAQATLKDCLDRTDATTGAHGAPADDPQHEGDIPISHSLQASLSRPSHSAYKASFVNSTLAGDSAAQAIHHSQAGYLGGAWFQRLNGPGPHRVDNATFLTAMALHFQLPISAFEGLRCGCGCVLKAATGAAHIQSCTQFNKLARHETLQDAFDSIIQQVDANVRIEGQRYANGTQRRCAPYADVPVLRPDGTQAVDPITGVGLTKAVIPDRVVRNFSDGILGQSGRYIVDTCVPAPEVASHVRAAAKTPLAAANKAYAGKYAAYAPHLQQHDALLAVVAETWGGLHPAVLLKLRKWATHLKEQTGSAVLANRGDSLSASYMSAWRMRLSVALLHGRVNLVHAAVDKLHGAPARTNTAAYRISHPLGFVRELGRLGRR